MSIRNTDAFFFCCTLGSDHELLQCLATRESSCACVQVYSHTRGQSTLGNRTNIYFCFDFFEIIIISILI
jgi:hypothetical protein